MVKDFRSWLGNTGNKHTQTIFERCALSLVSRMRDRDLQHEVYKAKSSNNKNNKKKDDSGLEIDSIFLETYVMAIETNLFGDGPPRHMTSRYSSKDRGDGRRRERIFSEEYKRNEFSTICDKALNLNEELLELYSIGEKRLSDYFNSYLKKGDLDETYRGNEDENYVSLQSLPVFKKEVQDKKNLKISRVTSTLFDELNKGYTAVELVKELKYLNETIESLGLGKDQKEKRANRKDQNIIKVILLRERIKLVDKEWEARRRNEIKRQMGETDDDRGITEIIEKELQYKDLH